MAYIYQCRWLLAHAHGTSTQAHFIQESNLYTLQTKPRGQKATIHLVAILNPYIK